MDEAREWLEDYSRLMREGLIDIGTAYQNMAIEGLKIIRSLLAELEALRVSHDSLVENEKLIESQRKLLEQAEAERDRIKQAAVEAEKLLDAMAMDIGSYLSEPVRKLYAEVHTNLRDALKAAEER